jgi:hypothetical protein
MVSLILFVLALWMSIVSATKQIVSTSPIHSHSLNPLNYSNAVLRSQEQHGQQQD